MFGSTVPTAEKLQVSPEHDGSLNTGFGATLPGGSDIGTCTVTGSETRPHWSFTVSVTVYVPGGLGSAAAV